MYMFINLTVALASQVYAFVQTYQVVYIKCMQFFKKYKLYFNRDVK